MSRNYPLILLIMIICCAKTKGESHSYQFQTSPSPHLVPLPGAAVFCYQCSGLTCEPLEKYLQPCDNDLNRPVARCYSVAWNLTNIYRGCYESADDNIEHCRDRRLTNCAICFGNGCNNQPLFQPLTKTITCKHCPYGMCPLHGLPRDDFHMCEPFLMTVTPSCYQLIDYAICRRLRLWLYECPFRGRLSFLLTGPTQVVLSLLLHGQLQQRPPQLLPRRVDIDKEKVCRLHNHFYFQPLLRSVYDSNALCALLCGGKLPATPSGPVCRLHQCLPRVRDQVHGAACQLLPLLGEWLQSSTGCEKCVFVFVFFLT